MGTHNSPSELVPLRREDGGKNVIITGASRGLGRAIAEIFAANGNDLFITSISDVRLYQALEELMSKHPSVTIKAKPFDLGKKEQAKEFGHWCLQNGKPDILINNAGSFAGANVHDEEEGALEEMIQTNLYSAYYLTRVIVPEMIKQKSGHIFNMSSIAGLKAYPGGGSYSISKFAMRGFSVNLREELKQHNIKVTTVYPGAAYTDSWAASGLPEKRFMQADDIAKMVYAASQLSPQACVGEDHTSTTVGGSLVSFKRANNPLIKFQKGFTKAVLFLLSNLAGRIKILKRGQNFKPQFFLLRRLILIPVFTILAFSLKAQITFMTVVPQGSITVGESFQVQYIIEDGEKISNFKPPTFKNFRIVAGPNIYMGSVAKGNEIKQLKNLVYTLEAIKPGYFLIEGATILVNGKPERSNDAMVKIISREAAAKRLNDETTDINSDYFLRPGEDAYEKIRNNLFLKMTVNKKTCFVGEPVLATFKLYSRLESRSDIIKNPGFYGFTVYDMINLADKEMVTEYVKGKLFDVHTLRKVQLYPLQEGIFTIDAMEVKNSVEFSHTAVNKKTEQEIVEGMLRNDSNEVKDHDAEVFESTIGTEPVVIKVKPAPIKSKPTSFSGATGAFNISASIEKETLNKNEEGLLEITISGKGNFIQLNAPVIEWPVGVEGFEPVVKDILDKTQTPLSGSRTFHYGFVSAKPGSYTIPAIPFSFFDPDSGKYKTITSSVMHVSVSNTENLSHPVIGTVTKKNKQEKKYWLIVTTALLLCLVTGYWFFVKRIKKPDVKLVDKIDDAIPLSINEILPASLLSSSIEDTEFYRSLHLSIWKFFNYYFHLAGSEMNKENLLMKLRDSGIDEKPITDTLDILQECETGMFTNVSLADNKEKLFQKTRKLFEEINPAFSARFNHA